MTQEREQSSFSWIVFTVSLTHVLLTLAGWWHWDGHPETPCQHFRARDEEKKPPFSYSRSCVWKWFLVWNNRMGLVNPQFHKIPCSHHNKGSREYFFCIKQYFAGVFITLLLKKYSQCWQQNHIQWFISCRDEGPLLHEGRTANVFLQCLRKCYVCLVRCRRQT